MARRATAVSLVCLLAAGPLAPPRAWAAAAPADCVTASSTMERHDGLRREIRGPEPEAPDPGRVAGVLAELAKRLVGREPRAEISVPTVVHVLTDGRRRAPDSAVKGQIATLNAAYGGKYGGVDTGVRFALEAIVVTRNTAWFADPLTNESDMKTKLRRGGPETLNLYIAQLSELVLGYSTYPYWYDGSPVLDGVVIDWRSLPGGALRNFNRGYTGVHEIGHWLGLFHTFENGCESPGDGVDDTPHEQLPTEGCPESKDSCKGGGRDPIHNFMDYAHDRCMSEFTKGQAVRMHQMWAGYRSTRSP